MMFHDETHLNTHFQIVKKRVKNVEIMLQLKQKKKRTIDFN